MFGCKFGIKLSETFSSKRLRNSFSHKIAIFHFIAPDVSGILNGVELFISFYYAHKFKYLNCMFDLSGSFFVVAIRMVCLEGWKGVLWKICALRPYKSRWIVRTWKNLFILLMFWNQAVFRRMGTQPQINHYKSLKVRISLLHPESHIYSLIAEHQNNNLGFYSYVKVWV